MNSLNYSFIGKPVDLAIDEIKKRGLNIKLVKTIGHKDKDILKNEIVISAKQSENTITLITSFFKININ